MNKFKKCKYLRGPSYFKIYSYSFLGTTTTIFVCIYIYIYIYIYILFLFLNSNSTPNDEYENSSMRTSRQQRNAFQQNSKLNIESHGKL